MALKNESQFQMYLDVLDIVQKHGYDVKTDKDGIRSKTSNVLKDGKLCGKVIVVTAPPANKESSVYALTAHAGLVATKEEMRSVADKDKLSGEGAHVNFLEGEWTGIDGSLYYFGHSPKGDENYKWVEIVDKNYKKWHENSPLYQQTVNDMERAKKKKPATQDDYKELEKEFGRLSDTFSNIMNYRDSLDLSEECAAYVDGIREEALKKALKKLEKLNKSKGTSSKHFRELKNDYTELKEKFATLIPYSNAEEKAAECERRREECAEAEVKAIYNESVTRLTELQKAERKMSLTQQELVKLIADYEDLLTRFISVEKHEGAPEKIKFCTGEIAKFKAYWAAAAYKEAAKEFEELEELPDKESFFHFSKKATRYKKVSKKFKSAAPYDDAAEMEQKSKKLYKSYSWKAFKKASPFILIAALIVAVTILLIGWLSAGREDGNASSGNNGGFYSQYDEQYAESRSRAAGG